METQMMSPVIDQTVVFDETTGETYEVCDSVIAVLADDEITEWLGEFAELLTDPEIAEFLYSCSTRVFDIDGQKLVIVADSGGEFTSADFVEFCESREIAYQSVIDTPDCTGIEVDEIYTGQDPDDDNIELLTLLHKVFN